MRFIYAKVRSGQSIACSDVRIMRRVGELDAEDFYAAGKVKVLASAEASTSGRAQSKVEIACQAFS